MSDEFPSTTECITQVIRDLEVSDQIFQSDGVKNTRRITYFVRAMVMLTGAESQIPRDSQLSDGQIFSYRHQVSQLVQANAATFKNFLFEVFDRTSRAITDGWRTPCLYRSAIQFLQDNFKGIDLVLDDEDREFIDEIDEIFEELATSIEPLPASMIPPGIPDSHWWWRLPSATPKEAADARYDD
ncbi:hypothetical protein [Nocardia spumae]|uniref:hypothetical protein n=1 Tax=Nocardia spumae TaxID=2887190 RepID=UPI001D13778E|nr:hypothetical protein [Nocardia spumae]